MDGPVSDGGRAITEAESIQRGLGKAGNAGAGPDCGRMNRNMYRWAGIIRCTPSGQGRPRGCLESLQDKVGWPERAGRGKQDAEHAVGQPQCAGVGQGCNG